MKIRLKRTAALLIVLTLLLLGGCFGSAQKEGEAVPEELFFDFVLTGEEGNDSVSLLMKFKEYDQYGQAVSIEPGGVRVDGVAVDPESSAMTGPYYVLHRGIRDFEGRHTVEVTLPDYKTYKNEFSFTSFSLLSGLTDTIRRSRLQLQFAGLNNRDVVRVLATDTSFTGEGINRLDTVWNNKIQLSRGDLSYLENGPVNFELVRESVKPLRNGTLAGGTLSSFYSIRRECWLQD